MEKIAIIDPVGAKAGMDYYNLGLSNGLNKNGTKVFLFSNFDSTLSDTISYSFFGQFYANKFFQAINLFLAVIRSCIVCKKESINTVILHLFSTQITSFFTFLVCKLFRLKIIVISHDVSSFVKDDNELFKKLIYNKWSSKIVVHNQFSYESLCSSIEGIKHKVSIIKHGSFIDMPLDDVTKLSSLKSLNLDPSFKYILFFGQIKKVKNLDLLLNAFSDINMDVKLIIAGKVWKDNFDDYQKIIKDKNLSDRVVLDIQFISDLKREVYFKCADLMVLPYKEIYQSGVLLMAMSYGIPTLVSNIAPFKEIISHNENGFIFQSNNIKDLSEKVNSVISDQVKLDSVSKSSIQSMKNHYDWKDIARNYLELI